MASQYWPNFSRQDIASVNIANGKPLLSQCGLTRERQRKYRQWETNFGLIYSRCLGISLRTIVYSLNGLFCTVKTLKLILWNASWKWRNLFEILNRILWLFLKFLYFSQDRKAYNLFLLCYILNNNSTHNRIRTSLTWLKRYHIETSYGNFKIYVMNLKPLSSAGKDVFY